VLGWPYVHCPETYEQFPSSFGNAEVTTSDGRNLFINFFFTIKTTTKAFLKA
jgi:hypothetical protein